MVPIRGNYSTSHVFITVTGPFPRNKSQNRNSQIFLFERHGTTILESLLSTTQGLENPVIPRIHTETCTSLCRLKILHVGTFGFVSLKRPDMYWSELMTLPSFCSIVQRGWKVCEKTWYVRTSQGSLTLLFTLEVLPMDTKKRINISLPLRLSPFNLPN